MSGSDNTSDKYRLKFLPEALEEWNGLDGSVRSILKNQLARRLENPVVPSARLKGELSDCYKIKLRQQGIRLVYTVIEREIVVLVLAIGRRDRNEAYRSATRRSRP